MIELSHGNLLDADVEAIVNTVNCPDRHSTSRTQSRSCFARLIDGTIQQN